MIPLQGRINGGALGAKLDDGIAAAVVSFTTGLLLISAISLATPKGRAGLQRIIPAVRNRSFPRFYVMAGAIGALFVFAQSFTVALLGVALFTVAAVTGQTLSGLLVDRMGIGPGGKRAITGVRVLGSVLTVAAVAWAVSPPRFSGDTDIASLLLPVLLPLAAGFFMSFQQAMNGTATVHYGTPIAATLVNFIAGSLILWIAWIIKLAVAGPGNPLPSEWWYYLGGPWAASSSAWRRCWSGVLGGPDHRFGHDRRAVGGGSLVLDVVIPQSRRSGRLAHGAGYGPDARRDHRGHTALAQGSFRTKSPSQRPVG